MAFTAETTDNELVEAALAGSAEAYGHLVARFERPLLSLIRRMVQNSETAEDLAQEAFVKAFRHLKRFDLERKFSSWLFKIAHNTTLDHLRRRQLQTVPLEATSDPDEGSWEVLAAPEHDGPEARAERQNLTSGVEAALAKLKPAYREILLLRFLEGLAYDEIAEVTGLKMGTVKVHLHRARKLLATELEAAGFAAPERFQS